MRLDRLLAVGLLVLSSSDLARAADPDPFAGFLPPNAWQDRFWDDPDAKALLALDAKALAALVPIQAGFKFARCPACDAEEAADPFVWSANKPRSLACRMCGQTFPNDKIPAKVDGKVPEETVEVLPGVLHRYPYHVLPAERQHYPDERIYLDAKRDYETREALARAALYAAARHRRGGAASTRGDLARFAAVLILRFAQVYPAYATHFDQPGRPKFLQRADLGPPYRRGYGTGKWDWTASLDVPMNLVTAYAAIRDEPCWPEVGRLLGDPDPRRTIERGFFRASAEFVRRQADENDEMSLGAYRGLFAVGRLLDDRDLLAEARGRLDRFTERGFFHDGYWRQGDARAHRRVVGQLDGWIGRLAAETAGEGHPDLASASLPMIDLARVAAGAAIVDGPTPEVRQAAWPAPRAPSEGRRPAFLGGVGLARLSVGGPEDGLDIELRGMGNLGTPQVPRLALRASVAGRTVLDDFDDQSSTRSGWDLATASHNAVVVDGLNQRETPVAARSPAGAGRFLYYAADPDFQVVAVDDPLAYPKSTTTYRQIVLAASGPRARYGVSVFQVEGGLQHDQIYHGPAGGRARWMSSLPTGPGPASLLATNIPYLAEARAEDGRWFVQALGEFRRLNEARASAPSTATLAEPERPGLRLHLLGSSPSTVLTALTPDPTSMKPPAEAAEAGEGRASLVVRRRSADGSTLATTFVTVLDPVYAGPSLVRVGRVPSPPDCVVLLLETADGQEHLVINLHAGTPMIVRLADGRDLSTDGLSVRVGPGGLHLAGGTFARLGDVEVRHDRLSGRVVRTDRDAGAGGRGAFEVEGSPGAFAGIEGRTLLIRHGDDSVRGWTILGATPLARNRVQLAVREEPGFAIDPASGLARYYQFPRVEIPGPHHYSVSRMSESPSNRR